MTSYLARQTKHGIVVTANVAPDVPNSENYHTIYLDDIGHGYGWLHVYLRGRKASAIRRRAAGMFRFWRRQNERGEW